VTPYGGRDNGRCGPLRLIAPRLVTTHITIRASASALTTTYAWNESAFLASSDLNLTASPH